MKKNVPQKNKKNVKKRKKRDKNKKNVCKRWEKRYIGNFPPNRFEMPIGLI